MIIREITATLATSSRQSYTYVFTSRQQHLDIETIRLWDVAWASSDNTVRLCDVTMRMKLQVFKVGANVLAITSSADGFYIEIDT
jgi:WD40 repeat protein